MQVTSTPSRIFISAFNRSCRRCVRTRGKYLVRMRMKNVSGIINAIELNLLNNLPEFMMISDLCKHISLEYGIEDFPENATRNRLINFMYLYRKERAIESFDKATNKTFPVSILGYIASFIDFKNDMTSARANQVKIYLHASKSLISPTTVHNCKSHDKVLIYRWFVENGLITPNLDIPEIVFSLMDVYDVLAIYDYFYDKIRECSYLFLKSNESDKSRELRLWAKETNLNGTLKDMREEFSKIKNIIFESKK